MSESVFFWDRLYEFHSHKSLCSRSLLDFRLSLHPPLPSPHVLNPRLLLRLESGFVLSRQLTATRPNRLQHVLRLGKGLQEG